MLALAGALQPHLRSWETSCRLEISLDKVSRCKATSFALSRCRGMSNATFGRKSSKSYGALGQAAMLSCTSSVRFSTARRTRRTATSLWTGSNLMMGSPAVRPSSTAANLR